MSKSRPQILFIVDHPNWAHDFKTQNLARVLGNDYDIQKRYQTEVTAADLDRADLILVYYWLQLEFALKPLASSFERYSEKLLVGICSNWELESERREPGLATLLKFARAVFVNNMFLYREYGPILDVQVFYTPNGVDTNFFYPAPAKELSPTLRVGWAGSLTNREQGYRGYDELIVPAVNALDRVELITADWEKRRRGPAEMREFYQSLDLYICASQTDGTPNPCLEAAACGVPLLTTRVGNMPELVRHGINGLFFDRNLEDLTDKLRSLRDSPALRLSLGEKLLDDIRLWDWSIQAQNYRHMFEKMLTRKASVGQLSTADVSGSKAKPVEQLAAPSESVPANVLQVRDALLKKARASLSLLPQNFLREHRTVELTIVLLSYGRLERTLNAIRALQDNVLVPFKLLLIDNNSGDEVRTKLAETCAGSGFIELILLDENLGCAGGRDLAFKRVTTKYVMLLDNDLEVLPGALEHLLHQFDLHPQAAAVTGKVVLPDGRIQLCGANFLVENGTQFVELLGAGRRFDEEIGKTGECDWVPGCMALIRTDMLRRFPYDLEMRHYFEDNEWCYRINDAGAGKFYRAIEALGIHYHEGKAPSRAQPAEERRKQTMKFVETLAYFYRKHNLLYEGMFYFVPEFGPSTNPLSISSARIFLQLVNAYGGDWVLNRWNQDQLAPLFGAQSLSARLAEKEQAVRESSAQVAEKEHAIRAAETERGIRIAEREQAITVFSALSTQVIEKEEAIQAFAAQVANQQQALRTLSAQVAAKEAELKSVTGTLAWRLLRLYGKIKYRYLLPVYRLLDLMPREPTVSEEQNGRHRDTNEL
jgi:GT2 family glycosyltransferase/glycosyltransferase involved in cell wall biosynthesis/RES domain-containing protein